MMSGIAWLDLDRDLGDVSQPARLIAVGGRVRQDFAPHLTPFDGIFQLDQRCVALHPSLTDYARRSAAMAEVLAILHQQGLVPGWRNEFYPVGRGFNQSPLLQMERAATP